MIFRVRYSGDENFRKESFLERTINYAREQNAVNTKNITTLQTQLNSLQKAFEEHLGINTKPKE